MKKGLLLFMVLGCAFQSQAQNESGEVFKSDTFRIQKNTQIMAIPVVFYTPETEFGLGGGLQVFYNRKRNVYLDRISNMLITAVYTTKSQFLLDVKPQLYFERGNYFLDGLFKYKVFPNSFWGIGNQAPEANLEQYNMRTFYIKAAFLKYLPPDLNFGFEYKYEKHEMLEFQEGGQLIEDTIPGSSGARVSGLSVVFNLDDRDDLFSPLSGNLLQFTGGFSSEAMGADFSYSKYLVDLRKYFPIGERATLATQLYTESTFGNIPFQTLAWLGGQDRMRGYFRGRYMDENMLIVQAEIRHKFHSRFWWAAFGAYGEVSDVPSYFFRNPRVSYGGGIRFQVMESVPTLIRLDIGLNGEGGTGVYFGVNEAF